MRDINELYKLIKKNPAIITEMNWADETDNFDVQRIHDIVLCLDEEKLLRSVTAMILAEWKVLDSQNDPRCFHTLEDGRIVSKFPNRNDYSHEPIVIGFGPKPTVSTESMSGILYYLKVEAYRKFGAIWEREELKKRLKENISPVSERQQWITNHDDNEGNFANKSDVNTKKESSQNNNGVIEEAKYDEEKETLYWDCIQINDDTKGVNTAKMGRPKAKEFKECIRKDTPSCFLPILTEMLKGKRGKDAAQIIKACIGEWIDEPPYKTVTTEFESVKQTAYREAMKNPSNFPVEIIQSIRDEIQEKIDEYNKKMN